MGSMIDNIYVVLEYVEHDLKALMETMRQPFLQGRRNLLVQSLQNNFENH